MHAADVKFRNVVVDESVDDKDRKEMEVIEITYPDGKVIALPATDVNAESGRRYCDLYAAKYQAFKNGDPDPDHVQKLEREIKERQDELKSLGTRKDDKRVQDNLGYGKVGDDANPQQAKVAAGTKDKAAEKTAPKKKAS